MLEGGKIDGRQAVYLNITYIIATALLSVPSITTAHAGRDAWISSLLAILIGLSAAWVTAKLGILFPQKILIEYPEKILGKWPGKILGLVYILYFLHICAVMVREVGDFLSEVFLVETPLVAINIVIVALGAFTVKKGLEVLARANQIFLPLILLSVGFIFLLLLPEMDFSLLLPVFEADILAIFKGSLAPGAWNAEIIAFAMIIPFLSKPGDAVKIALTSVIMVGIIFSFLVLSGLATFGPLIQNMIYPVLNASRIINIANFLERLEPLIMVVWVTGGFVKITFFYYIIVLGSARWLNLKDYRPLAIPFGIILISLSLIVGNNLLEMIHFISHIFPPLNLTLGIAVPAALLAIARLRGQGGKGT